MEDGKPGFDLIEPRRAGNNYLEEITGKHITAKDFRTWAGTVLAAMALNELESFDNAAQAKRNLRAAIEKVAGKLGNTPTICRKCYVHPEVLNSYMDGNLVLELKSKAESELRGDVQSLKPEEAAVLALLRGRLAKEAGSWGGDEDGAPAAAVLRAVAASHRTRQALIAAALAVEDVLRQRRRVGGQCDEGPCRRGRIAPTPPCWRPVR